VTHYKPLSKDAKSANATGRIVLYQVKKVLHCHFPTILQQVSQLSDIRSYKEYRIEELVMGGIMLFLFKSTSRNDFDHKRKDSVFVKNDYQVFRLRLPGTEAMDDILKVLDKSHQFTMQYKWVKDIDYQKRKLNWVEGVQTKVHIASGEQTITKFVYITDMEVNRDNIIQLVEHARSRWNIEESFNTQKNRGYQLHHKFNRKNFTAIKNWHSLRLIAHLVNQLIEKSHQFKELLVDKETIKNLWEIFRAFFLLVEIEPTMIEQLNHIANERMQVRRC